ncbi:MAG: DsbA family protein [Propionibacteriaceae bacterium]|nr:DsbA family protein [Propionibacteriaceae bacterium]
MAKVKRSEVAAQEQDEVSESTTTAEPETSTKTSREPREPRDARDQTIRTLQILAVILGVTTILLAVTVMVLLLRGTPTDPATPTETPPTAAPVFSTTYIPVTANPKPNAIVVELHDDYQCPWCARAELIFGDALWELAQSGDIDLRIQVRTLVGDQIIHNDSSRRASLGAICADKAGFFWGYHSALFANQPQEGVGFTDDQLRVDFPAQAGITGKALQEFQTCYDTQAEANRVEAMENEGQSMGIHGTPAFMVNGIKVNFNLQPDSAVIQPITAEDLLIGLQELGI